MTDSVIMMNTIPQTISAGDEVEVQLAPVGDYPQLVNGSEVTQKVDESAISNLVANFTEDVLVDADHDSESGRGTEAMAWVTRVFSDPERGLVGVFRFTDKGADAVSQSRYRFVSPAWTLDDEGRPSRLVSVGLTNKPNLPVHPVLNMRTADQAKTEAAVMSESSAEPSEADKSVVDSEPTPVVSDIKENTMNDLKPILGLPEEATDEEVMTAVQALVAKIQDMEAAKKDEEAEEFATANADCVEDRDELKADYLANPEATKRVVENCRKAMQKVIANSQTIAQPEAVVNVETAEEPVVANSFAQGLAQCKTPEERLAYCIKH